MKAKQITYNNKRLFGGNGRSADDSGLNTAIKNLIICSYFLLVIQVDNSLTRDNFSSTNIKKFK